jgi:hypothetical protein
MLDPAKFTYIAMVCGFLVTGCNGSDLAGGPDKAGTTKESASDEEEEEEEEIDEDLKVIPPEIVSGAYLTCGRVDDGATAEFGLIGAALVREGQKGIIDIRAFNPQWRVFYERQDIDAETVQNSSGFKLNRLFRIPASFLQQRLVVGVSAKGAEGSTLARRCAYVPEAEPISQDEIINEVAPPQPQTQVPEGPQLTQVNIRDINGKVMAVLTSHPQDPRQDAQLMQELANLWGMSVQDVVNGFSMQMYQEVNGI